MCEHASDRRPKFIPSHSSFVHTRVWHTASPFVNTCVWPAESGDFFAMITKENNGNGLDFHAARFYAAEIALALDYIHEKEVIYRDLKPENLLLCGDGHVMLADFGLSKRTKSSGRHGSTSTVGTPAYFAPELVMSEQYSKSVDWWAYGVVVFELLCGKEPFKGQNIKETMKNVVSKTPKLPPSVAKKLIASNSKVRRAVKCWDSYDRPKRPAQNDRLKLPA